MDAAASSTATVAAAAAVAAVAAAVTATAACCHSDLGAFLLHNSILSLFTHYYTPYL